MKAYLIDPPFAMFETEDARTMPSINLIADIVFACLRRGSDTFQHSVVWADPGHEPHGLLHEDTAEPRIHDLSDADALKAWLRKCIDPNRPGWGDIRSIATCRTATFGYDGQVLLLLRHDDPPPVSPNPALTTVQERPDLLVGSDWFVGWAGPSSGGEDDEATPTRP